LRPKINQNLPPGDPKVLSDWRGLLKNNQICPGPVEGSADADTKDWARRRGRQR